MHPSKVVAFIVDAVTGNAYTYIGTEAHVMCGWGPRMSVADMIVSVHWTYSNHIYRISIPPCGRIENFGGGSAFAAVPIGPCDGKASVFVHHEPGRVILGKSVPLGVRCGTAYDPAIPKPSTCAQT
ncbi:MAG: hypothetical protein ACXVQ6_07370 [Actinomycetota bacterium]